MEITEIKLPRYQDTGRCRGYAHVTFKDPLAFKRALSLSGKKLGTRYLDIMESAGKNNAPNPTDTASIAEAMPADCKTLFVKNLPYSFKEDDLGDRFRPFGEVEEIRLTKNWQTG